MWGVEATDLGDDLAQRGKLSGVGVHAWGVGQSAGHPDGTLAESLREKVLHVLDLGGGGRALVGADREQPQGALGYQVGRVGGDALIEPVEVLGHGAPGEVQVRRVTVPSGDLAADHVQRGVVDRRVGDSVLTDDLGGDSLADLREVAGVGEQPQVGVGVHVDEPRRQHDARTRLDDPIGAGDGSGSSDVRDPAGVNHDVGPISVRTGAVDHVDVSNQQVGHQGRPPSGPRCVFCNARCACCTMGAILHQLGSDCKHTGSSM